MDNQRNLILAIVMSAIVLLGWSLISERYFPTAAPQTTRVEAGKQVALPTQESQPAAAVRDRVLVLRESPRVRIDTPRLGGSINLVGARIDDLVLKSHSQTIADGSPPVRLLSPEGAPEAYLATFGWTADTVRVPDARTRWTASGDTLAPGAPVTLSWNNGAGLTFDIIVSVDENYLFTVQQRVRNASGAPVAVRPYSLIARTGASTHPEDRDSWTIHTGPVGYWNGSDQFGTDYDDLAIGTSGQRFGIAPGGWLGFGDKYWLTALLPAAGQTLDAGFFQQTPGVYSAAANANAAQVIAPGQAAATATRLFAGAKENKVLDAYQRAGIGRLDLAIDWGWFYWFELPIFFLLSWLFALVGNFGVAIILLTCVVRGLMFPIAQRQFASMAAMRALQPKLKQLQERHKDDKQKLQTEMLALYKREKVNPLAGCLPILLQIPVFYALYKVLMLTIEMRHQPFALWIRDLSAPDPLTPLNLFGLLPFTPPTFLAIGVLPILLGITMYLQFKLNPTPPDPVQQQVFSIMPWIFMFIMAPFAAGLQLYWVMSNVLTIAQQKWLYSRHPALQASEAKA
ncbi:YidC/Oxa1 family membrane protein insertase [Sphingomonas jejuensis]|uniref:Membrane protein insertase YidC n=1 Tax=Sphingomonas jejuensis TaxID=904715 RepID=A0ABX0XIG3_9SPHN|nr:membrane protein insertase YidC [Sphingomonas jejuensis]NJC33119.1 YidC/Oxa1 family membrane protein insertase [Sphingomonas jejuensis]